jgi:RsmE family RNA methyltransferase
MPGAAMADRGGVPPTLDLPLLLIGPEGGWAGHEQALDLPRVALGTHVLRAETAAVVAGAMLAGLRGGIVGPAMPIAT